MIFPRCSISRPVAEEAGFESVWVGDSLFSKPRYEPISLLSAISQRTKRVRLGTACLVSATRNPLYLALEWATLDVISGGRTILGACMGNPEEGVRREYAALGLDFNKRAAIFEEGLHVLRALWTEGRVDVRGRFFQYDDISFSSGVEMGPLMPIQHPPPIWIVSNPRLIRGVARRDGRARDRSLGGPHRPIRRRLDDLLPGASSGELSDAAGAHPRRRARGGPAPIRDSRSPIRSP